jgi:hypothetical protein
LTLFALPGLTNARRNCGVQTHRDVRHAGSEPLEHTHASGERNESVGEINQSDITDIKSARGA